MQEGGSSILTNQILRILGLGWSKEELQIDEATIRKLINMDKMQKTMVRVRIPKINESCTWLSMIIKVKDATSWLLILYFCVSIGKLPVVLICYHVHSSVVLKRHETFQ